jgi:hypothetical protein
MGNYVLDKAAPMSSRGPDRPTLIEVLRMVTPSMEVEGVACWRGGWRAIRIFVSFLTKT